MKKVNFITSLSPEKQYAIKRWFLVTCVLGISSLVVVFYFVVPQILAYVSLKKEVNALQQNIKNYNNVMKNKDTLKAEHDMLRMRTKKIDGYKENPKNPHQYIAAIMQACGADVVIENIQLQKKNSECTLLCSSPAHATVFIKRLLATELFSNVRLISLQHDVQHKQFRAVIKGVLI